MLACYRYIELNPVRAKMVRHPQHYRWSSYRTNAEGKEDALITPHEMYQRLGRSADSRLEAYRALFKAHVDDDELNQIRSATNGNYVFGSERFQEQIGEMLGRRVVKGNPGRPATCHHFHCRALRWQQAGYCSWSSHVRWPRAYLPCYLLVLTTAPLAWIKSNLEQQKGFVPLRRRWVVERTFGWMMPWGRLVRDYEKRLDFSENMIYVAMSSLLLSRIFQ